MGLDMRPLNKPKAGKEQRFYELYRLITSDNLPPDQYDALLEEWFGLGIPSYETINAPQVGKDARADAWLRERYDAHDSSDKPPFDEVYEDYRGYYVIELAPEQDSVPVYRAFGQDENVFRGQFLADCQELIGEDLLNEAWSNHLAEEAVDYAQRLIAAVASAARQHGLEYLKDQYEAPEAARRIVRRLEDGGFRYPVIERAYHRAGHYLFPVESRWHKLFANARRYPQDYMAAARDALAQALDFFHGWQ